MINHEIFFYLFKLNSDNLFTFLSIADKSNNKNDKVCISSYIVYQSLKNNFIVHYQP